MPRDKLDNARRADPVDKYVGNRIRMRRRMLNLSQEKLAEQLGITFQQVQKYEKGTNRVGAGRLYRLARILQVPIPYFFPERSPPRAASGMSEDAAADYVMDFMSTPDGIELNRAFAQIGDQQVRRQVINLVRTIAAREKTDG